MNLSIVEEFRRNEERVLDRLVDGELGQHERRELLAALDDEPGAWRRCALAFLEAQTWRGQLTQMAAEPLVMQAIERARLAPATNRMHGRAAWAAGLAIAASLLVAFGLGTRFPIETPGPERDEVTIAKSSDPATVTATDDAKTTPVATQELAEADPAAADDDGLETVTLAPVDGKDGGNEFQLAVVKDSATDSEWASAEESTLPARLIKQLEATGFTVTRQQRFWPVDLADGRRLVVPVDEVDVSNPEIVQY